MKEEDKNKKVVVDPNKCFRCGFCVGNYPDKFTFSGTDGAAAPVDDTVTPDAEMAVEACPAGAITIEEK